MKMICESLATVVPFVNHRSDRPGQIARPMLIGRTLACKIFEMRPIFQARKICFIKKKKSLDLQIYSRRVKQWKIILNSEYYRDTSALVRSSKLAWKWLYLLMDWETFDSFMTVFYDGSLSYRKQFTDLPWKSMNWFVYDMSWNNQRCNQSRVCSSDKMTPIYFLRLSKVWSILHHGSVHKKSELIKNVT